MRWIRVACVILVLFTVGVVRGQSLAPNAGQIPSFELPQTGVEFVTGDTWRVGGETFRLFGVQSCLRGTTFTNAAGEKRDCGEASILYTAAMLRDARPRCAAIAKAVAPLLIFTVCAARIGEVALDLGTILITEGFAFAARDASGQPINAAYAVEEREAKQARRGLWAALDLPIPTTILLGAIRKSSGTVTGR
jgi:endonuclease YncB( thermonuclease family)